MAFLVKAKRFIVNQTKEQAFNTDTILLANFVKPTKSVKTILEVGTGSGAIMLYLASKFTGVIDGIEIQENRYLQTKNNIDLNDLKERLHVYNGDFTNFKFNKLYDLIVANPPFFKVNGNKRLNKSYEDMVSRHEVMMTLEQLISKVAANLKYGGYFYMIHRPDRIDEIISLCEENKIKIKKIRFVYPYKDKPANHVLIEAIKNGKSGIIVDKPLIIYQEKHVFNQEMKDIIGDF